MADGIAVGRVRAIYRYPVKSMRGEELNETRVWWHGVEGDRKYAFVRAGHLSGFPWLTGREIPEMIRYQPYLADAADPVESPVRVRTPSGEDWPVESEELLGELTERYGGTVHLLRLTRGTFDSMSLSLISEATLRALGEAAGMALEPQRFRPNLLIEPFNSEPFAEETWLGGRVCFGEREDSAQHRLERRNVRCMMVNLDPESARQTPQVLRTVVAERDKMAGIYGSTLRPGTIRVGDVIHFFPESAL